MNRKVSTASVAGQLDEMDRKLRLDLEDAPRGPLNDAMKVLVPALLDQNRIMRDILELVSHESLERMRATDPRLSSSHREPHDPI